MISQLVISRGPHSPEFELGSDVDGVRGSAEGSQHQVTLILMAFFHFFLFNSYNN